MSLLCHQVPPLHPQYRVYTLLPGPTRKRCPSCYAYQLCYRNPDANAVGCVMQWDVQGGRLAYQIALERDDAGGLHVHCTCADAVFRAEAEGRFCKHIRGLLEFGRPARALAVPARQMMGIGA